MSVTKPTNKSLYVLPPSVVASICIFIKGSIPGEYGLDVLVFSYLRSLFKSLTEHVPVKNVSKSLDLPRLIDTHLHYMT